MITQHIDLKYLWGRINKNSNDSYRLDLNMHNGSYGQMYLGEIRASKRLHYNAGLFLVFTAKPTKIIKISYYAHNPGKEEYKASKKQLVESQLCAKEKNTKNWVLLNHASKLENLPTYKDVTLTVPVNLNSDLYEEYQLCLPWGSLCSNIQIETDNGISLISPPSIQFAFVGSSVTANGLVENYGNISCQLYRLKGINVANCGITGTHSLIFPEIHQTIQKYSNIKWICGDTIMLNPTALAEAKKLKNLLFYSIETRWDLYQFKDVNYVYTFRSPEEQVDTIHPSAYGVKQYLLALIKKGVI